MGRNIEPHYVLEGEFNGRDVNISVVTNNNKVYRIVVRDANSSSETSIKIRFNNLCQQFANNSKYTTPFLTSVDDYIIPEDEDISYEMAVNNKRYQASFYQKPDSIAQQKNLENYRNSLLEKYTEEELSDSTTVNKLLLETMSYAWDILAKKSVWFMIFEFSGEYYIVMYYDNVYNEANGEDL